MLGNSPLPWPTREAYGGERAEAELAEQSHLAAEALAYAERGEVELPEQSKRDPGPNFSKRGYLADNPGAAALGLNPLLHYVQRGRAEGRRSSSR